ncbi:MAG: LCP family protein [Saccharofermentans sp.]|nr:LCP family protein [Saccharofermentans sp.]
MSSRQTHDTAGSGLWKAFAAIVFIIQALASAALCIKAFSLGMIPDKYLYGLVIALWLVLMISALLLFVGTDRPVNASLAVKRAFAVVIAAAICFTAVTGYKALSSVKTAVDEVTADNIASGEAPVAFMNLYVNAKDPARTASDCKSYVVGTAVGENARNSKAALNKMAVETGTAVKSKEYASEEDLIYALYRGKLQAVIINSAKAEILTETTEFEGFIGKARLIKEYDITESDLEFIPGKPEETSDTRETNPIQSDQAVEGGITTTPFILYISGSDTRNKQFKTSRSDVNILMVVNPKTRQILLLNTPRDYYIPNPKSAEGERDKLTHLGLYGVGCSMQGLGDLYGCTVNYSAQINFTGLETLVDELGGITVDNPQEFSVINGYHYKKGKITLNGKEALAYARERHAFTAGDNMRGQNQMRIITAIINKATSNKSKVLMNYSGILNALSGMFKTSLPSSDIEKLVKMQLTDMAQWKITTYAVTGKNGSETTYSSPNYKAYVMWPDDRSVAEGASKIRKVMDGKILP